MKARLLVVTDQRRWTYHLLSQLFFKEVSTEYLDQLRQEMPSLGGFFDDFFRELPTRGTEEMRKELAADFTFLFLGMSKNPIAPYESFYTSREQLLMQDSRDEVVAEYRSEGLISPSWESQAEEARTEAQENAFDEETGWYRLPEDHVSFELDYMAVLCRRTARELERDDADAVLAYLAKQQEFLERHVLRWIPNLCDDVIRRARTSFYRDLAEMTKAFIGEEIEHIDEVRHTVLRLADS